ncbi:MAG: protein translocase subunit SecF [Oscillospiraceae bacterium]|nr:protein translocase subunit SecF [Oscillospiraceae bacterium]
MKKWNIDFYAHRKLYFTISALLIAVTLIGALVFGVSLDIQFKGGAIITYSYSGDIDKGEFQSAVEGILGQSVSLQETTDIATGSKSFVVSTPTSNGLTAEKQAELADGIAEKFAANGIETASINVVNPTIGHEFLAKCLVAIGFAAVLMIIYISLRFSKISGWSAGITAVIALLHDLVMVFAAFVLFGFSVNANFIAVCLTILGYSLNDTIVIYDRVRENKRLIGDDMAVEELMNLSLNQSFTRSLMTSVTTVSAMTIVSVVAILYNVTSILSFSFPMIIGMVSGFYSSTCIAPMLWVIWQKKKKA